MWVQCGPHTCITQGVQRCARCALLGVWLQDIRAHLAHTHPIPPFRGVGGVRLVCMMLAGNLSG